MRFNDTETPKGGGGGNRNLPPEGDHVVECVDAEEKTSKNGDPFISLKLKMEDYNWHVFDVLMGGGKGAGLGKKKAEAFGVDADGDVQPGDFVGQRVVAHLVYESYQGKRKLAVDISQGDFCGYSAVEDGAGF